MLFIKPLFMVPETAFGGPPSKQVMLMKRRPACFAREVKFRAASNFCQPKLVYFSPSAGFFSDSLESNWLMILVANLSEKPATKLQNRTLA